MRSGLFTTMWCAKGLGPDVMIRLKRHRKQTFIRRRLSVWWDFKGVMFFELLLRNQQSIWVCTVDIWTVWTNPSSRNVQSSLIVKELCSITTTRNYTQVWSSVKNYWSLDGMCCHTHHTRLTLCCQTSTCFTLFKTPCV